MEQQYTFRQITNEQELEHFMQLRMEIYGNSRFSNLISHEIDIDTYDLHSLPFGLFCNGEPAGFIRVILPKADFYNSQAYRIGLRHGIFNEADHAEAVIKAQQDPGFHVFKWLPDAPGLKRLYAEAKHQGMDLTEGSRIMLFKKFRGLRAARFLTECTITTYFEHNIAAKRHAVITCVSKQQHYYKQYGFELLDDNQASDYCTENYCIMVLRHAPNLALSPIAERFRQTVAEAYEEYWHTGTITRGVPMPAAKAA